MSSSSSRTSQQNHASANDSEPLSFPSLPLPTWKMILLTLVAAILVFFSGATLDWLVFHERESRIFAVGISDVLAGVVAGVLVYRLLQYERDRRRALRQRLEIIADMNHHVRNALQVISLSAYSSNDRRQLDAIKESVSRIQWALREILPKL